jgi:hypothetical protein
METKTQNIIIITASVIISAAIWIITMKNHPQQHFESRVFKVVNGWGYDILVNDSIVIHQESVPAIQTQQAFAKKDQAEKTARLVIQKLKDGQHPTLTKFDLEKILRPDETNDNRQRNLE